PPSLVPAPRAPSRTSRTCCVKRSDTGSRAKLMMGSASSSRSYGRTQGSTAQPPSTATAASTSRPRDLLTKQFPHFTFVVLFVTGFVAKMHVTHAPAAVEYERRRHRRRVVRA